MRSFYQSQLIILDGNRAPFPPFGSLSCSLFFSLPLPQFLTSDDQEHGLEGIALKIKTLRYMRSSMEKEKNQLSNILVMLTLTWEEEADLVTGDL